MHTNYIHGNWSSELDQLVLVDILIILVISVMALVKWRKQT